MINVQLELEDLHHSIEQSFDQKADATSVKERILCKVYNHRKKRFTLSNGDRFAREEDVAWTPERPNVIGGLMILTRGRDGASCEMMTYNGSHCEIFFEAKLDAELFNVLLGDVRAGISPTHATVQIDSDFVTTPLRFGPAPDGSHLVWNVDSEKNHTLPIKMISFWHDQPEPVMPSEDKTADASRILTEHLAQLNYRASVSQSLQNIRNGLSLLVFAVTAIGVIVLFKL